MALLDDGDVTMALLDLSDDALGVVFEGLRNTLDPHVAVALSSVCHGLWAPTKVLLQQLKADHEAAAALCLKVKLLSPLHHTRQLRSCKDLREAKHIELHDKGLTTADLAMLGTLGSLLPALEKLFLCMDSPSMERLGPDGVQRLAEGLGAGALPALVHFAAGGKAYGRHLAGMPVGDADAWALAAALGRGAMPRLKMLSLGNAAIGDAGLVALAPALRRLPALECLGLQVNPLGDEGLVALVAPPATADALPLPTGGLTKLKTLSLHSTQVSDAGCASLVGALDSGAMPALGTGNPRDLKPLNTYGIPASAAAVGAVQEAVKRSKAAEAEKRSKAYQESMVGVRQAHGPLERGAARLVNAFEGLATN